MILESDNIEATRLIIKGLADKHACSTLRHIQATLLRQWAAKLQHIARESNRVADYIWKLFHTEGSNLKMLEDPVPGCRPGPS